MGRPRVKGMNLLSLSMLHLGNQLNFVVSPYFQLFLRCGNSVLD